MYISLQPNIQTKESHGTVCLYQHYLPHSIKTDMDIAKTERAHPSHDQSLMAIGAGAASMLHSHQCPSWLVTLMGHGLGMGCVVLAPII